MTCRSLSLDINTRLHVPPQWSNLRSLTALYLAATLRDYPIISLLPDLKVLAVDFYGTRRDEEDEEDQLDQLLVPGLLTSLTRLEVSSAEYLFPVSSSSPQSFFVEIQQCIQYQYRALKLR